MIWLGVAFGAVLFMLLPIATVGVPLPASMLSAEKLDAHAKKCASFPVYVLKQPLFLVKMVAGLCWAADPRVRAQFNLPAYDSDPGTWRTT